MSDPETLRIYDVKAQDYAGLTKKDADSPELAAFIAAVHQGGRVLDLGCGPGHMAAKMAAAGLIVDALDASAEMVALANAQIGVTAHQATFDDLDAIETYDGIFANFSLLHASRARVPDHIAQISRALRQSGVFHIALKTGSGEARDGLGRHYCYFSEPELEAMLAEQGFDVLKRSGGKDMGMGGRIEQWVALLARKSD